MSEFRQDLVTGKWTLFAGGRDKRPNAKKPSTPRDVPSETYQSDCPFCPGNESQTPTPELLRYGGDNGDWRLRVVPNKFRLVNLEDLGGEQEWSVGPYRAKGSRGIHEVIVDTRNHIAETITRPEEQVVDIFRAYQARILSLRGDTLLQSILPVKNCGIDSGTTLEHAHSQIIALPFAYDYLKEVIFGLKHLAAECPGLCGYCEMIDYEIKTNERVITQNKDFLSFFPFAGRSAYNIYIIPKAHRAHFEESTLEELTSLASIVRETATIMDEALHKPHFNWYIRTAPFNMDVDKMLREEQTNGTMAPTHFAENGEFFHWRLTLRPKVNKEASVEYGGDMHVNSVYPEVASQLFREAAARIK